MIASSTQARAAPLRERGNDLYETPPPVTEALLRREQLPHRIWEPAAGKGAIVNVRYKAPLIVFMKGSLKTGPG